VTGNGNRHCEEHSDEAIWEEIATPAWGVARNDEEGLAVTGNGNRHCEEHSSSSVIARSTVTKQSGKRLPRFARNDEEGLAVTGNGNRHCEERSAEAIWEEIATLRSQ
jgi:hypothetical protein